MFCLQMGAGMSRFRSVSLVSIGLVVGLLVTGVGVNAARSRGGEVICERIGKNQVSCPKRELRGKKGRRGARGGRGPAGAAGPAGPPGQGVQFAASLPTNADPRPVLELSGIRIEAGCTGGAVELTLRSIAGDHNIIQVTSFDNLEGGSTRGVSAPDIDVNIPIPMLGGSGFHDYNGLLSVRSLSGEVVTGQWFAMGSQYTSQGDCVVGGTISP